MSALNDVRAAFPDWEITLTGAGYWAASLTTAAAGEPVTVTCPTLGDLARAINDFIAGTGDDCR